jgi:uncharacterized protein with GYD domain
MSQAFRKRRVIMAKYLVRATYTADGVRGVLSEGGNGRREAVRSLIEGLGGTLDAFYFAFGETDVYAIVDLPDNASAAAASLAVSAAGATRSQVAVLLTPDEVDAASKKTTSYRAPGT